MRRGRHPVRRRRRDRAPRPVTRCTGLAHGVPRGAEAGPRCSSRAPSTPARSRSPTSGSTSGSITAEHRRGLHRGRSTSTGARPSGSRRRTSGSRGVLVVGGSGGMVGAPLHGESRRDRGPARASCGARARAEPRRVGVGHRDHHAGAPRHHGRCPRPRRGARGARAGRAVPRPRRRTGPRPGRAHGGGDPAPRRRGAAPARARRRRLERARRRSRAAAGAVGAHGAHAPRRRSTSGSPASPSATTASRRPAASRTASGAVALLKGPGTIVASPPAPDRDQPHGRARLATAGTGDVLSGIIGGLAGPGRASPSGRRPPAPSCMGGRPTSPGILAWSPEISSTRCRASSTSWSPDARQHPSQRM